MTESKYPYFEAIGRLSLRYLLPENRDLDVETGRKYIGVSSETPTSERSAHRGAVVFPGSVFDGDLLEAVLACVDEVQSLINRLPQQVSSLFGSPAAFLVDSENRMVLEGLGIEVRDEFDAVSFAELSHVLVKFGEIENASLKDRFPSVISLDFPADQIDTGRATSSGFALRDLADECLVGIVRNYFDNSVDLSQDFFVQCSIRLAEVFSVIATAYRDLMEGPLAWQVYWVRHINYGLVTLSKICETNLPQDPNFVSGGGLEQMLFPAFSLPNPELGLNYKSGNVIATAIKKHWHDEESVIESLNNLAMRGLQTGEFIYGQQHPLSEIIWSSVDSIRADRRRGIENSFHSFDLAVKESDGHKYFAARYLPEDDFFHPTIVSSSGISIWRENSLTSLDEIDSNLFFLGRTSVQEESGKRFLQTDELTVRAEAIGLEHLSPAEITSSAIAFQIRNANNLYFVPVSRPRADGDHIAIQGVFRSDILTDGDFEFLTKIQQLEIQIPNGDPLKSHVLKNLAAKILMISPDGIGALMVEGSSGIKNPRILSFLEYDKDGKSIEEELIDITRENVSLRMFIWNSNSDSDLLFDGNILNGLGIPQLGKIKSFVTSLGEHIVEQGRFKIILEVQPEIDPQEIGIESPLRACIEDREVDPILNCRLEDSDIRVSVEDYFFKYFCSEAESSAAMNSCGHIVVSSDRAENLEILVPSTSCAVMHSSEFTGNEIWPFSIGHDIPQSFLQSEEVRRFRAAYDKLEIREFISQNRNLGGPGWISKVDLSKLQFHFYDDGQSFEDRLSEVLMAHRLMIAAADATEEAIIKFWARYPFTVSVWKTSGEKECSAVLLSPFHPIRLAWMYLVQTTLRNMKVGSSGLARKRALAGTVSGWNFPQIGPREASYTGQIAVAMDNGFEGLFAGWSILVKATVGSSSQLSPPLRAGDNVLPGIEANGLDTSAVKGSLRDFVAVNPFLSTLVIDLAANSQISKDYGVDNAIIEEIGKWGMDRRKLGMKATGARIYDSVNRVGALPERSDSFFGDDFSLSWSRYESESQPQSVNLKIINDVGLSTAISPATTGYGEIGGIPLRRFEVPKSPRAGFSYFESAPTLRPSDSINLLEAETSKTLGEEFRFLLEVSERALSFDSPVSIKTTLGALGQNLGDADWVISGENGVSPAAVVSILESHAGQGNESPRMMWDWRPPFLDSSAFDSGTIDRRPYLAISRLPRVFVDKLAAILFQLLGREPSISDVNSVLRSLGGRGLGLSSMMRANNKHQTHQKGAIGFSLVFDLFDALPITTSDRFILPLDVCNAFIGTLGGSEEVSSDQLADAVLIHIDNDCLVFCPIEIKLYSLESPVDNHPDKLAEALSKPKNQSSNSSRRLIDLSKTWAGKVGSNNYIRPLLANGVASLIEAAMKLNPRGTLDHEVTADRLRKVADGSMNIRIGESLIAFLQATSSDRKISVHRSPRRMDDPRDHIIFMADPRYVAANVAEPQSDAVDNWNRAVNLATGFFTTGSAVVGNRPEDQLGDSGDIEMIGDPDVQDPARSQPDDLHDEADGVSSADETFNNSENGLRFGGVHFEIGDYLT